MVLEKPKYKNAVSYNTSGIEPQFNVTKGYY
jgi:hypothetical protein